MSTRVFISGIRTKAPLEEVKSDILRIVSEFGEVVGLGWFDTTHGWVDFAEAADAEIAVEKLPNCFYKDRKLKAKFASKRKIPVAPDAVTEEDIERIWQMVVNFELFNTAKELITKRILPPATVLSRAVTEKKIRMAEYLIKKVRAISADDVKTAIAIKNFKLLKAMYNRGARADAAGRELAVALNFADALYLIDDKQKQD
jgi:hypothetical protein